MEWSGRVLHGDCLEEIRKMSDGSVDAIVTDPPYGLGFMGREWDTFGAGGSANERFQAAMTPVFAEALRVAKPGAHLLCFGGTRTFHRLACAMEDAGWEVRDCIMWVYGSGMPHGQNVGGLMARKGMAGSEEWLGWNTQLKPAWEPIIVARKPLDGTVAHNVMAHGTGAINIDGCRVPIDEGDDVFAKNPHTRSKGKDSGIYGKYGAQDSDWSGEKGRFPANLAHDGSDEVLGLFPDTGKSSGGGMHTRGTAGKESTGVYGSYASGVAVKNVGMGDSGSSARFFYCAKASKKERGEGNDHLTVKPIALMEWLVKLVAPSGGVVLDPFAGSGTTLVACKSLGVDCIGVEKDAHYCEIARKRLGETGVGQVEGA